MAIRLWVAVLVGSVGFPIGVTIASVRVFRALPCSRGRLVASAAAAVWTVASFALAALLIFTGGGHPPPIVLLPLVPFSWALLQAATVALAWFLLGRRRRT